MHLYYGGIMMKILHLSDLHFHTNTKDNKKILKTLDKVKEKYPNHFIVVTGDIVDDGHEKQFKNAYNALKDLKGRIFIVPGNHDFGAAGNFYSRERAARFDEMLAKPLDQGGTFSFDNRPVVNVVTEGNDRVVFIGLDSNLETESPFDFACGEIGKLQRNALAELLSDSSTTNMKKILFFHHHPFIRNDPFMEMKDSAKLARTIYGRVDAVLFGHKHEMALFEKTWGIPFISASDNSPGKDKGGELTIEEGKVSFQYVQI